MGDCYSVCPPPVAPPAGQPPVNAPNILRIRGTTSNPGGMTIHTINEPRLLVCTPGVVPSSVLLAYPLTSPSDQNQVYRMKGHCLYLPKPGKWAIISTQAADVDMLSLAAPDFASYEQYKVPGYSTFLDSSPKNVSVTVAAAVSLVTAGCLYRYILIQNIGTTDMMLRWDGTAPTATVGVLLKPGGSYEMSGDSLHLGQAIQGIGVTADVNAHVIAGA